MQGPASTQVEHSLHKILRPRGPWFDPRRGNLFRRDNINSHVCLTVTQQSDGYFQSCNLESKKAVATSTLYEEGT